MDAAREQHLLDEIARRDAIIARQAAEIQVLRQAVDALTRKVFGVSSEKLDSNQLQLLLEGDDWPKKPAATESAAPGPAAEIRDHKKRRRKTRAPRIPDHLPVQREELIPAEVRLDPAAWRRIGEETREQLGFKPAEFYRVQLVRPKYVRIGNPAARPVIAPLPPSLQDRCIATPGLIAEVIDNRFVCHLPYYRQEEIFARLGVRIHRKTLCDWTLLASEWLAIIYRQIQYEHWRSPYRQIDETPIPYLDPGSGKSQQGYLWTSNIPGGSVFYHWHDGRDAAGLDALFEKQDPSQSEEAVGEIQRIIQCDGYSAYPSWAKDKPWIKLMGCHAHMRRKFFEAAEQAPRLVAWILRQIAHLYHIEKTLRETKAGPALRQAVRASESRMIHQRLHKAITLLAKRRILPKSKLGKAVHYALRQWPQLEHYLTDGRVEIDNNLVENAIRPTKLGANYANMRIMRRCFSNPQPRPRFEIVSLHNHRLSRNRKSLLAGLNRRFFWLGGCIRDNACSFI
ncbi:MAG: IS66 family transposase [Verrucomicrobiae bacterium]|nr:IS66 family transposase [Verrucomicrobiae bacterium]